MKRENEFADEIKREGVRPFPKKWCKVSGMNQNKHVKEGVASKQSIFKYRQGNNSKDLNTYTR